MKPQFTKDGIEIQTLAEVTTELEESYKGIYGDTIDLDQNTPDGQKLGIEAKLSLDTQTFGMALAQSFDPDFSEGLQLDRVIKICGIVRKPSTQSSVVLTITTDRALTLSQGLTVADDNNQSWILSADTSAVSGANTITFLAEEYGNLQAAPDTVTNIVTVVLGVLSATNPAAAIEGLPEENDEQLKIRRNLSLENPGYSTSGNLEAKLSNLITVTDLKVYENQYNPNSADEPVTQEMLPNSLWIVINGGVESDIIETAAKNKTGGTAWNGAQTGIYTETRVRPNGTTYEYFHHVRFDRPTEKPLEIRLTVQRKVATQPIDIALIKQMISTQDYLIGESAQANELYGLVYQAGTNFIVTELEISLDGTTWTDGLLTPGFSELFTVLADNITITGS
jgi:uncharacterized phage protein gp47/JayE